MELKGKHALITGGAQRVGKAITLMLAEAGVNVAINYNASATAAEETVAEAQALGCRHLPFRPTWLTATQLIRWRMRSSALLAQSI